MGFEPTTISLATRSSTTELPPQYEYNGIMSVGATQCLINLRVKTS